jgi:hypothetical protein
MVVNDNAGSLTPRDVLESIASKLAPTGDRTGHTGNVHFSNVAPLNKSFVQPASDAKTASTG